jgi:Predicted ATPase with chaperone activity
MATRQLKQHCKLSQDSQELIRVAMSELNLSARAYDRILKVSRTIADLDGKTRSAEHVSEAIQYRTFDRTSGYDSLASLRATLCTRLTF